MGDLQIANIRLDPTGPRLVIPIGDNYESDLSKSIKELESDNIDMRAEAVQTLARIGEASGKHRVNVLDILSSFVRRQTPWRPGMVRNAVEKDVQLALKTIALIPRRMTREIFIESKCKT